MVALGQMLGQLLEAPESLLVLALVWLREQRQRLGLGHSPGPAQDVRIPSLGQGWLCLRAPEGMSPGFI